MDDTVTIQKKLITEALKQALDKANVPQRQHLMVVQALQRRMAEHQRDMAAHQDNLKEYAETLKTHEAHNKAHERQIEDWDTIVKEILSTDWTGAQGEQGIPGETPIKGVHYFDGKDADIDEVIEQVLARIPVPENGKDGADGFDGKDGEVKLAEAAKIVVKYIKDGQMLDLTHIKGAQKFIKDGVSYKVEELMHGGGSSKSSSGTSVYNEVVSGTGTSWTLAYTPITGTVRLFGEGQRLLPTTNYTISGATITTVDSWPTGAISADYNH